MKRIAINGFGRIGRTLLRTILSDDKAMKNLVVPIINCGPCNPEMIALLFKHDSIMGPFPGDCTYKSGNLIINGQKIAVLAECDPGRAPWRKYEIDFVVEATGHFTTREGASKHLAAGAKKVLITAPAKEEDVTIIPGVNDKEYISKKHHIVSLGSCTTNAFATVVKVIVDNFNLEAGLMTTTHAYTNSQVLLDVEHKDPRRARAASLNIIPTKTGAEGVISKIFPTLAGKIHASAIRVPVPIVSLLDFTFSTTENLTVEGINAAFLEASATSLKNIVGYTDEPLVSSDFAKNPHSSVLDSQLTVATKHLGKVFAWYDNEWGYSERLKDFLLSIA